MHRLDAPLPYYYHTCVLINAFLPVGNVISFISKAHYLRSLVLGPVVNRGQGAQGSSGSDLFQCPYFQAKHSRVSVWGNYKQRLNINDFVFTKWGIETEYTALLLHNTDFRPSIRFLQSCQSLLLEKSCFPWKTKRYGYRLKYPIKI